MTGSSSYSHRRMCLLPYPSEFLSARTLIWPRASLPGILYWSGENSARKEHGLKRWLRIAAGFVLLIMGVMGLALPILPGWIFAIPGLVILSRKFPRARRLLQWAKSYMPKKTVRD